MHATPEACEQATDGLTLRGPVEHENPHDRTHVADLLLGHPWKAATSERYKTLPHEYSLKKHWVEHDFIWCVEYIRRVGYEQHFLGRVWIYYDIGEHQYWDCGGSVSGVGLINRAVRRPA